MKLDKNQPTHLPKPKAFFPTHFQHATVRTLLLSLLLLGVSWCDAEAAARLALIANDEQLVQATDLLTAELSHLEGLEVLERAQIEKVYREQAMAATQGGDFVKLGQILGAEGIMTLELTRVESKQHLSISLVAVRPGAVIRQRNYPWPVEKPEELTQMALQHFKPVLPKLAVLPKDALPISILNLRSAVRSAENETMERQLTILLQSRLVQEPSIFVLERRKMSLLTDEKGLKQQEDTAFWSGSFLVEGTIDRDGYSAATATLSAQLIAPRNGPSVKIEVSGSRTNLPALADSLTIKIMEALHRNAAPQEWNRSEEAARFQAESAWATRWKMYAEGQEAAEAAWALGKQDLECAAARVRAYVEAVPAQVVSFRYGEASFPSGHISDHSEYLQDFLHRLHQEFDGRVVYAQSGRSIKYAGVTKFLDPALLDHAIRGLSLYHEFARTLPSEEPKAGSPWYQLGIDSLMAGSRILEYFHSLPAEQQPVAGKLSELRSLSRSVSQWLSRSASVRNSYWVTGRMASSDELRFLGELKNIFACEATWGCFWQEKPEDARALYKDLMSSPAFAYINNHLWFRPVHRPRLAAWNAKDRARIPEVWAHFMKELSGKSDPVLQLEGKFLELADVATAQEGVGAFEKAIEMILQNRGVIVSNSVDVLYLDWHLGELLTKMGGSESVPEKTALQHRFATQTRKILEEMREERKNLSRQQLSPVSTTFLPMVRDQAPPPLASASKALKVSRFIKFPLERLNREGVGSFMVASHRWREGRLWMDCRFEVGSKANRLTYGAAAAIVWQPRSDEWDVIRYPGKEDPFSKQPPGSGSEPESRFLFEVFGDALYVSDWNVMRRFDLKSRQWEELSFPGQKLAQLFAIGGKLYAANDENIYEIREHGKSTQVLASCRRKPTVSALDSMESLGWPKLFSGFGNSPCALIRTSIHKWNGSDWQSVALLTDGDVLEFDGTVILRSLPHQGEGYLLQLNPGASAPQRCWAEVLVDLNGPVTAPQMPATPGVWLPSPELTIARSPVVTTGTNLFFFVEHSAVDRPTNTLIERDGRHANLVCLVPESKTPVVIPLRFDLTKGVLSSKEIWGGLAYPAKTWMVWAEDSLVISQAGLGGAWAIPHGEIAAALSKQLRPGS